VSSFALRCTSVVDQKVSSVFEQGHADLFRELTVARWRRAPEYAFYRRWL